MSEKTINPGRLRQFKKGFPPEECPKCWTDGCDLCNQNGVFVQRLDIDWEPPELLHGDRLIAIIDLDEWECIGVLHDNGEFSETPFPFQATGFATGDHMRAIGFSVQTT